MHYPYEHVESMAFDRHAEVIGRSNRPGLVGTAGSPRGGFARRLSLRHAGRALAKAGRSDSRQPRGLAVHKRIKAV